MKRTCTLLFIIAALIPITLPLYSKAQEQNQSVQVTATVIGRFRAGRLFILPGSITIPEYILVRVVTPDGNLKKDQFIQIRLDYSRYSFKIPENFFKQAATWKFT